jgi:hypothetical protein
MLALSTLAMCFQEMQDAAFDHQKQKYPTPETISVLADERLRFGQVNVEQAVKKEPKKQASVVDSSTIHAFSGNQAAYGGGSLLNPLLVMTFDTSRQC